MMDAMGGLFSSATIRSKPPERLPQETGRRETGRRGAPNNPLRFAGDGGNMDITIQFNYNKEFETPGHWTGNGKILVRVLTGSTEHQTVSTNFFDTLSGVGVKGTYTDNDACILEIQRVENILLYEKYTIHRKHVADKLGRLIHEVETKPLWHGTEEENVNDIVSTKFDRGYAGDNAVTEEGKSSNGRGCYFATAVHYSADDLYCKPNKSGVKFLFQVAVVTGKVGKGDSDLQAAPIDKSVNKPYDSAVDSFSNPRMYVVFDDCAAYPEYLVKYRLFN